MNLFAGIGSEDMRNEEIVTYNSVKNQTTKEYFADNEFAVDAFTNKYALTTEETYVQAVKRVCDFIASAESTPELQKYWAARWFNEIYNDWWHPGGSIMQGANSGKKVSMANCTTISLGTGSDDEEWDSLEGIIRNASYTIAKCAAYRQGLGLDVSRLRPVGTSVMNSANESSGPTHWMRFIDSIGSFVGQKGRIPAFLLSLNCSHPSIIDFITLKGGDYTKIQNANLSVQCTEAFYKAVEADAEWTLRFDIPSVKKGDKIYVDVHSTDMDSLYDGDKKKWYYIAKKDRKAESIKNVVQAREVLELIAKYMCNHAEPGIQNIDIARKYSNSDYVYDPDDIYDSRIISTNACSEQYLSNSGLCVLASMDAGKFSTNPEEYEAELSIIGESMVRFLDNVNTMEVVEGTYATPFQRIGIEKLRRIGAGYTNVAAWLFNQNLDYGTDEGNDALAKFTERFNYHLYKTSIALGAEKGSFGLFVQEKFEQSPFVQRMMKLGLEFTSMRNCNCSTIAPSGTISLMFRDLIFSYGIEPAFGLYFWKRTRIAGYYEYYFCVPAVVKAIFAQKGLPIPMDGCSIKDTFDGKIGRPVAEFIEKHFPSFDIPFTKPTGVKPLRKLDLMSKVMKSIDSSISVTYMLPENSDWKDVYEFILEAHKKEVKSIAAFPDAKIYGIVSYIPFKNLAVDLLKQGVTIHDQNFIDKEKQELASMGLVVGAGQIKKADAAPDRQKILQCDIHHVRFTKMLDKPRTFDYLVIVGLMGDSPYEVFVMENGHVDKKHTRATITKMKSGIYNVSFDDGLVLEDITKDATEEEDLLTRMTSTALRHGIDISYVVDQLEKAKSGAISSFSKAMSRALKKYVRDGTKVKGTCPKCGGSGLVRESGCVSCACGWSKCS